MKIKNIKAIAFIKNLEKAYTEGVYADTPANRKLGRVGMSYKEWTSKQNNKEEKIPFKTDKESGKGVYKISNEIKLVYHPASRRRSEPYYELEYGDKYKDGKAFDITEKEVKFIYSKFKKNPKELENIVKESKYRNSLSENLKSIMNKKDSEDNSKENKEKIPFNESRRGGKALRLSKKYTLYKSNNGKIFLDIDTIGSKDLSEEEAVELYNNYKKNPERVLDFLDKKYKKAKTIIKNNDEYDNDEYDNDEMEEMARREEMRAYHDFYNNGGHFADGSDNNPFK